MTVVMSVLHARVMEGFLEVEKPKVSAQGYDSIRGLVRRVLLWFESEGLCALDAGIQDAVRYLAWLGEHTSETGQKISTGTMHNYLKAARRLFEYLVITQKITTNPFRELSYPRLGHHISRNVLTEAQMGCLLRELGKFDEPGTRDQRLRRYRVHVIAEFLYATGLRIAEASALVPEDVEVEKRLVRVRSGKGGKPRTAFLTSYAAAVMAHYFAGGRAHTLGTTSYRTFGHTVFGAHKERLTAVVNGELDTLCRQLELPVITSHGFRHSLGTHLLRSGCDMRHIQVILGHESIGTTQIYTHVDKDDLKRSLDAYHPRRWNPRGEEP